MIQMHVDNNWFLHIHKNQDTLGDFILSYDSVLMLYETSSN